MAGINEIAAQHIERSLRGMPADALAIAGKAQSAVTAAIGVGKSDVNQTYRLLRATSGLTAPLDSISSAGTSVQAVFRSLL